jgi:Transposase DDE domain
MRNGHYTLSSGRIQQQVVGLLQDFLKLPDFSDKCSAQTLWLILCAAAARMASVSATCQRLANAPSDETVRQALLATTPAYAELQRCVNRALAGGLPKALTQRRQTMAIDLTLLPYHGQPLKDEKEVYRSKAKSGTSHFHAYASAYVVSHGLRYTVALTPVDKGEKMEEVVKRLLRQAAKAGVKPRLLLLDRGFYSVGVIRYLQCARVPFLMPAAGRGPKPKKGQAATGIRAFQLWKSGGWGEHTLRDVKKRSATVSIGVHCGNHRGRRKRHGRYAWVYAYWGFTPHSTRWLADTYRSRFGIETSYRQMNQARIRTCTRDPRTRFLYVAIALLLRNAWVWLHWELLSSPRRGRRRLNLERCRLRHLLSILVHVAETILGTDDELETERPPPPEFRAA